MSKRKGGPKATDPTDQEAPGVQDGGERRTGPSIQRLQRGLGMDGCLWPPRVVHRPGWGPAPGGRFGVT